MENTENLSIKSMIVLRKAMKSIDFCVFEDIKKSELTITQFGILEVLYSKGTMKIGELMEKVLSTSGNMTVVIKNLEKKGLIEKICCPFDKRAFMIDLTEKGREIIEELLPKHIKLVEEKFDILSDEEKKFLIKIMKKFKNTEKGADCSYMEFI